MSISGGTYIDLVAPFGGGEQMMKEIKLKVFSGVSFKVLENSSRGGLSVREIFP